MEKITQAREKSTKIKFLGPETARWGGGLPREGVVAENFVPTLETLSSLGFEERNPGCPGNFAGMSRTPGGVQKFVQKNFVRIFRSLITASAPLPLQGPLCDRQCDWEALSRPISHPNTDRGSQPPRSKLLKGLNRAIVVL